MTLNEIPKTDKKQPINNRNFPHKSPANIWWALNMHLINLNKTSSDAFSLLTVSKTKKLLTHKPACHIRLLPIRLHTHMWVVYLRMFHVDIQLQAYMLSNFHQTSHQSTCKNYQTISFSASFALCQMIKLVTTQTLEITKPWNQVVLSMDLTESERVNFHFSELRKV